MEAQRQVLAKHTKPLRQQIVGADSAEEQVTCADLLNQSGLLGRDYRFSEATLHPEAAVLRGRFATEALRSGLILHTAAVTDLASLETSNTLCSGLKIVMVVGGATDVTYGDRHFMLGPDAGGPAGAMIAFAHPDAFGRRWRRGRSERKVVIALTPDWLADTCADDDHADTRRLLDFSRHHLALAAWRPSAHAMARAGQILTPPALTAPMRRMYQETRSLEIAAEAFGALAPAGPVESMSGRRRRLLARLRELLDSGAADALALDDIARAVGTNAVSLQALSRQACGMTVFDYLRERRLLAAHGALEDGLDVGAAAQLAGYASPGNFATAFKRRFGLTPRAVRRAMRLQ
ncbi:MAG: helix-turn-helix transcriptional regulator [Rhodocyclaceae bacterium]